MPLTRATVTTASRIMCTRLVVRRQSVSVGA